jgi:hypothetical protein
MRLTVVESARLYAVQSHSENLELVKYETIADEFTVQAELRLGVKAQSAGGHARCLGRNILPWPCSLVLRRIHPLKSFRSNLNRTRNRCIRQEDGPKNRRDTIGCRRAQQQLKPSKNGSAHILDMVDIGNQRVLGFEIVRKANASGRTNHDGISTRKKLAAVRRMVTTWEDD